MNTKQKEPVVGEVHFKSIPLYWEKEKNGVFLGHVLTSGKPGIYKDMWALAPGGGYPGAFPRGFINRLKKTGWWGNKRLWMFSGSFKDAGGTTVDIKPELGPDLVCNCENLELPDESYDFVCLDPPYSEEESSRLYGVPYVNLVKAVNEAARVCSPGGLVLLLHRIIPSYHPNDTVHFKRLKMIANVGVFKIGGYSNIFALTVWRKQEDLNGWLK